MRAAVYCRISQDRVGGGLGVSRQRDDCEALARDRGWKVAAVYEDNDISAYTGRMRPGYKALLTSVAAGEVDVVLAWHTDRLHRSPRELEEYIETCAKHDVATVTVRAGALDLSTAAGRMVARMLGAAARHESEQKSERVRRAREQEARSGKVHGSLGYGWRRVGDGWEINQDEARVVREIAARLLAGEPLGAVARDLNERAVPTPGGLIGGWRSVNLRQLIMAARLAGWREWTPADSQGGRGRGRGLGDFTARGDWPAILDRETTERLRLLLSDPSRWTGHRPGRATYLLSGGLVRCGRCGAPLTGHSDRKRGVRNYTCARQVGLARCGRLGISTKALDELVTAAVLEALATSPLRTATNSNDDSIQEVQRLRRRLEDLARDFADEHITRGEWLAARQQIERRMQAAERRIVTGSRLQLLNSIPRDEAGLAETWASMTLPQQRALITAVLDRIVVHPATRGGHVMDPSRIELVWRA